MSGSDLSSDKPLTWLQTFRVIQLQHWHLLHALQLQKCTNMNIKI